MAVKRLLSTCTVTTVGLLCKAFLNLGFCSSVTVNGLHYLVEALQDKERNNKRGIVTVANHISVLDDPVTWGALPLRCYTNVRDMRWALGASDIMFTNSYGSGFSTFFRYGQVLETFRGSGIYQEAVDSAIEKLNEGSWVHLFGEGKVNQPYQYPVSTEGTARLPRFKWGTARIIMETQRLPTIIPMWLSGFEQVMPEPRSFPRFLPRLRKDICITFAPPIDHSRFRDILDPWRARVVHGGDAGVPYGKETDDKRTVRIALTDVIQREVESVGYGVSGPLLGAHKALPEVP